ncbi:hypothetical protein LCGC14_2660600, partial [marine sediment metagenome]
FQRKSPSRYRLAPRRPSPVNAPTTRAWDRQRPCFPRSAGAVFRPPESCPRSEWRHRSRRYYRRPKTKQERTANSSLYNSKSNEWCRGKRTPHALDPWSSIERPIDLNYKSWKNRRKKKTIS